MKALRKMILGETWAIPIGVALILLAGLLFRDDSWWSHAGGFVLLAGVVVTLSVSLRRVP
jgi:uncharacterized membrane protein YecN with MAPEG domain